MAIQDMTITGVLFDDVTGELTFKLAGQLPTSLPPGVREDLALLQEPTVRVGPVALKKTATTPARCIFVNANDGKQYVSTWTGSTWSSPVLYTA